MKKVDLQKKTDKELEKSLAEKRKSLADFRFGMSGSKTRNVFEGKNLRKEIARILTEQNRRKVEVSK